MQPLIVLAAIIGALAYSGELPGTFQFPMQLVGAAMFTALVVYALAKA